MPVMNGHNAGSPPPCAWYQFTLDRKGKRPEGHLLSYTGWVHADRYSGFNGVFVGNMARLDELLPWHYAELVEEQSPATA